ncbi:hypothetical protein H8356DRAFT_1437138 [Neocallimastix lanati (nom. inval.)]|nr:hypothetical protein H8356DRAFT_1437138 [Neocallimastix sp. JGI-2020a]
MYKRKRKYLIKNEDSGSALLRFILLYQLKFNLVIDKNYFNSILIIQINIRNIKELETKGKTTTTRQIMEIIYCDFPLKLYSLESYGRELQHMLKSTLLVD